MTDTIQAPVARLIEDHAPDSLTEGWTGRSSRPA